MQPNVDVTSNLDIEDVFNDVRSGIDRARGFYNNGNLDACAKVLRALHLEMWGLDALIGVSQRVNTTKTTKKNKQTGKKRSEHLFSIEDINQALSTRKAA